jgi:hypothetical protein
LNHSGNFHILNAVIDENLTVTFNFICRNRISNQSSLKPTTFVSMGYRLGGGVVITDKSLAAISRNCKVLGIGVAVKVSVSTLAAIVLICLLH